MSQNKILITGGAGFIGFSLAKKFLANGYQVVLIDSLNDYYQTELKIGRLKELGINYDISAQVSPEAIPSETYGTNLLFHHVHLSNKEEVNRIMEDNHFDYVIHMAAQAGVRYSFQNPQSYIENNIDSFGKLIELAKDHKVKHFIYASSSSVYGLGSTIPYSTDQLVGHPVSLYAATKRSNELFAHVYSHAYGLPTTGLRFFTVYGPWGRPDMAYFSFVKAILEGKPIDVYNGGKMMRDFTFIDDICESIFRLVPKAPQAAHVDPAGDVQWKANSSSAPFALYNIGNSNPYPLIEFIETIEQILGKKAKMNFKEMQIGDIENTKADVESLNALIDFQPGTSLHHGLTEFINWYLSYYQEQKN